MFQIIQVVTKNPTKEDKVSVKPLNMETASKELSTKSELHTNNEDTVSNLIRFPSDELLDMIDQDKINQENVECLISPSKKSNVQKTEGLKSVTEVTTSICEKVESTETESKNVKQSCDKCEELGKLCESCLTKCETCKQLGSECGICDSKCETNDTKSETHVDRCESDTSVDVSKVLTESEISSTKCDAQNVDVSCDLNSSSDLKLNISISSASTETAPDINPIMSTNISPSLEADKKENITENDDEMQVDLFEIPEDGMFSENSVLSPNSSKVIKSVHFENDAFLESVIEDKVQEVKEEYPKDIREVKAKFEENKYPTIVSIKSNLTMIVMLKKN